MADMNLPDIFNPVLSYLADTLPPPVFSLAVNALSHVLAILTFAFKIFSFITSHISSNPLEWDAQTILPPFLILAMAYFALLSFYRTTTWMLRTSVFFVKWGTFFAIFMAGVGYLLGDGRSVGRYGSVVSGFGNFLFDTMNDSGGKARSGGTRSRSGSSRSQSSRTGGSDKRKLKAWDSYEKHRGYEATQGDGVVTDAQKVISEIVGAAGSFAKGSGWWEILKGVVEGGVSEGDGDGTQHKPSQSKTKAGRSRSR
ncbi:hypothetical protein H0H87_001432 [Tephrocybe sp. NHM501043]|nr:hypothetical protein H0H87_001432 [Tephrocybe sp. NHM501043]